MLVDVDERQMLLGMLVVYLGLLSGDSTWCRCRDWFETASAQMSWIKAKYVIPSLELTEWVAGYVSYIHYGYIQCVNLGKARSFFYC